MTLEALYAKVRDWDFQHSGAAVAKSKYGIILDQLAYHAAKEWRVYLPAEHPDFNSNYMERLAAWVGNGADDADQKLLLEYALCISFFSHDDFASFYRTAMDREIACWVAEQIDARLEHHGGQEFHKLVYREIHTRTWFCPITDSMDINEFYKVNHLKGIGHRPGFATLQMLAEQCVHANPDLARNVIHYMSNPNIDPQRPAPSLERIVLLEDVVGSGTQCLDAVRWAVANLGKPILFVPLILCPNGVEVFRNEEQSWGGRLAVRPVIELSRCDLLGPERQQHNGWPISPAIEDLARRSIGRLGILMQHAFGYKETGCSLSTFSNTPDNSLPLIHYKPSNGQWEPLFPRVYRE